MAQASLSERARVATHVDLAPAERPPAIGRVVLAAVISVAASIGVDAALVAIGTHLFPSTKGFSHFRFFDYGALTLIGVALAVPAWPICARISSTPRWLLFRLAVLATIVLWLPDVYLIVVKHETTKGVAILMVMHFVIALITYNALVHIAPTRPATASEGIGVDVIFPAPNSDDGPAKTPRTPSLALNRALWMSMVIGVCLEFTFGIVALLLVPTSRPSVWVPTQGRVVYLVHSVFGVAILVGATATVFMGRTIGRRAVIGTTIGFLGIVVGAAGGLFAVDHTLRIFGMALMFVGAGAAFFGYLVPLVEGPDTETELAPKEPA